MKFPFSFCVGGSAERAEQVVRRLANLSDGAGLLQECEACTEHLSPGVVVCGRVSGQSDGAQRNQIRVPKRDNFFF